MIFNFLLSEKVNLNIFDYLKKIKVNDQLLLSYEKEGKVFKRGVEYIWHKTFLPTFGSGGSIVRAKLPIEQTNYNGNISLNGLLPVTSTKLELGASVGSQFSFFTQSLLWSPALEFSISQPLLRDGIIPSFFVNGFRSPIEQRIDIDAMSIDYNEVDRKNRYNKLLHDSIIDFFQYRYYQELLKIIKNIKDDSRKLYLFNRKRHKRGVIGDSEYLQSEINTLSVDQSYSSTQDELKKIKFKILLNLGYDSKELEKLNLNLIGGFFQQNNKKIREEELFNISLQKKTDLQRLQLEIKKKDLQIKNAINDNFPKLDLGLGVNWKAQGEDLDRSLQADFETEFQASFTFSAYLSPVFYNQMETYRLDREQLQHKVGNLKKSLKIDIRNGLLDLKKNAKNLEINEKTSKLRKELYLSLKKDYENGKIDYRFFIDAINNYRNSYQNYLNSVIEYQFSLLNIYYKFTDIDLYIERFFIGKV